MGGWWNAGSLFTFAGADEVEGAEIVPFKDEESLSTREGFGKK